MKKKHKFLNLIILAVFIFVGFNCYEIYQIDKELDNFGINSEAVALKVSKHARKGRDSCNIDYGFIVNGEKYTGRSSYSGECRTKVNDIVYIVYNSKNYNTNRLKDNNENWQTLFFIEIILFFYLLFALRRYLSLKVSTTT